MSLSPPLSLLTILSLSLSPLPFLLPSQLVPMTKILTVYLEHNPLSNDFEYRLKIQALLPSLTQLDATPCRR